MLKYSYFPIEATIEEIEVLRQLYIKCSDTKNYIAEYSLEMIVNNCDDRIGITKRKLQVILKNFESRKWIEHIEKGKGRNKSILKITFKNCINN